MQQEDPSDGSGLGEDLANVVKALACKFLPHLTVIPTTFDGDSYDT